ALVPAWTVVRTGAVGPAGVPAGAVPAGPCRTVVPVAGVATIGDVGAAVPTAAVGPVLPAGARVLAGVGGTAGVDVPAGTLAAGWALRLRGARRPPGGGLTLRLGPATLLAARATACSSRDGAWHQCPVCATPLLRGSSTVRSGTWWPWADESPLLHVAARTCFPTGVRQGWFGTGLRATPHSIAPAPPSQNRPAPAHCPDQFRQPSQRNARDSAFAEAGVGFWSATPLDHI